MKHCHCGLHEQVKKIRTSKLGLLGGVLIIGHLLFHVAECLILPAVIMAIHGDHDAEATSEQIRPDTHEREAWSTQILTSMDAVVLRWVQQ